MKAHLYLPASMDIAFALKAPSEVRPLPEGSIIRVRLTRREVLHLIVLLLRTVVRRNMGRGPYRIRSVKRFVWIRSVKRLVRRGLA